MKTIAYLYKWTQISTGMWYIGSRTAKGCCPADGYICSSKVVKPMILENKDDWIREILVIGTSWYILELEAIYLLLLNAKLDINSFNMHNGDGKFTVTGMKIGPQTETHKQKLSESKKGRIPWNKGKPGVKHSAQTKELIKLARIGKKMSAQTKLKISITESRTKQLKKLSRIENKIGESEC